MTRKSKIFVYTTFAFALIGIFALINVVYSGITNAVAQNQPTEYSMMNRNNHNRSVMMNADNHHDSAYSNHCN